MGTLSEWVVRLIWELRRLHDEAAKLAQYDELITWLETSGSASKLCAIPKDLNDRLFADQWSKGIPTILTSGTLSAAGDFSHTKRTLGLDRLGGKLTEISKPSPFNHRENSLLYISESMPFPDSFNKSYIAAITDEIERLIYASHGHATVLFTSYDAMGRVHAALTEKKLPFPLFRLDKGGVREIEKYKKSGNGVLFACNTWEGIDIPGDALSMLIIVKLPFQVPDAIGEYEQTLYPNMGEYKRQVIVPEMLIKLKQGDGRLIRLESDTGCVAILDSRAALRGAYRERVIATLPNRRITGSIAEVRQLFIEKKDQSYFK
jgi:ATP-dependent DNA helicase DinG